MRSTLLKFAFLATAAAAATAASAATPFDGPYVGAQIGWQQDRFGATLGQGVDSLSESENSDGFSYGGLVGYDFNINGNGVVGIEAGISGSTANLKFEEDDVELKSGRTIEIAGRAGALISNKTLIFGRAGWSNARFTIPVSDTASLGSTLNGFTVGAGIEHAVTDSITLRAEYAYSQYERIRSGFAVEPGVIETFSIRPTRNAVRVGASFHF